MKIFFTVRVIKHWNQSPRAVVKSPYFEIFRTCVDTVLSNLLYLSLVCAGALY